MNITEITVEEFRSFYPEFSDEYLWTDETLTRFLIQADEETGSNRWGGYDNTGRSLKQRGMFAYAAHRTVLNSAIFKAVDNGAIPSGIAQASSKSVSDESVSFAVPTPDNAQATSLGDFRATPYGTEFLRLRKRAGMGCVAV